MGVQLLNCPQLMQTFFAVFKIGAILVPVNPSLRIHELAYIYQDAGVAALVSSADYIDSIREARREATGLKHVILIGKAVPKDVLSYDEMIQNGSDELVIEETDNDDTAVMIYTAGTTGNPKGVMLTHYNWYTHVTGYYELVLLDAWGVAAKGKIQKRDDGQDKIADENSGGIWRHPEPCLFDNASLVPWVRSIRFESGVPDGRKAGLDQPVGYRGSDEAH